MTKRRRKAAVADPRRPARRRVRDVVWMRCEACSRWGPASEKHESYLREQDVDVDNHQSPARLSRERCWFCNPPPLLWSSEAGWVADHAWLEQDQKRTAESVDGFLEVLIAEAWWRRDYEAGLLLNKRLDWRDSEHALAPHLAEHPQLRRLAGSPGYDGGAQAIFDWARVPPVEADAYALSAAGWTEETIANMQGVKLSVAHQRIQNAAGRLHAALWAVRKGEAV